MNARPYSQLSILSLCVLLSGGVALVLQMALEKYLSTLVGGASHSVAIVLVLFFVGVALGGLLAPTRCNGWRWLVLLECAIGCWCLFVGAAFYALYDSFAAFWPFGNDSIALGGLRVAVAAFWVLPPTIAMGLHFPIAMRLLAQHGMANAQNARRLYAVNVLGAGIFALLVPYSLFYEMGVQNTLFVAAILCFVVAALVYVVMKPKQVPNESQTPPSTAPTLASIPPKYLYLAFFSGALFFALEILWFHLIGTMLGSHVYAFSMLLASVLVALAIAGFWVHWRETRISRRPETYILRCLMLLLVLLPLTAICWPYVDNMLVWVVGDNPSYWQAERVKLGLLMVFVVPVAVMAGSIYPAIFHALTFDGHVRYSHIGRLLACNTLGVIVGVLCMAYGLIDLFGAEFAIRVLWGVVALHVLVLALRGRSTQTVVGLIAMASMVGGMWFNTNWLRWDIEAVNDGFAVYYKPAYVEGSRIIHMREEFGAGITAVRKEPRPSHYTGNDYSINVLTNGKFEGNDGWHVPQKILTTIVASFYVQDAANALVIGLGTGHSSKVAYGLGFRTTVCEISSEKIAIALSHFSQLHDSVIAQNDIEIRKEDGRQCLLATDKKYALITADIGSVWIAGGTNLYSQQFYQLAAAHLSDGGVFAQQIMPGTLTPALLRSMIVTMRSAFPHVVIMRAHNKHFVLLASNQPVTYFPEAYARYEAADLIDKEREYVHPIIRAYHSNREFVSAHTIDALAADKSIPLNTDYNRYFEFKTPMANNRYTDETYAYLFELSLSPATALAPKP